MGQYYMTHLSDGFTTHVISPYDYGTLGKLTEHSWVGNRFCNAVVTSMKEMNESNGRYVKMYHVGDYSTDKPSMINKRIYNRVWGDGSMGYGTFTSKLHTIRDEGVCFVLNVDKNEYIRYRFKTANEDDEHLNHLMLLTAVGNGRGGGDYRGKNLDMVGRWAGDKLWVTDADPNNPLYKKIHGWIFKENR